MRKIVTSEQLQDFARRWPCAHFPEGLGVSFEWDTRGSLCDIEWFNAWSGKTVSSPELDGETDRALLAVSQDAQEDLIGSGPA
jgi:hypothetical protein